MPVQPLHPQETKIIVGGLIEKDGRYLLIQEAQAKCRGKWFVQAGHLEAGETIFEGALREIREESGCDVELTGLCLVHQLPARSVLGLYFTTRLLAEHVCPLDPEEILDARWYTYEEICALRDADQLRVAEIVMHLLDNARAGRVLPLDLISFHDDHPSQIEI